MALTEEQFIRYVRQILLDEIGEEGQERLLAARVLVVGAGGLGVPVASYLAAAGVGTLGIADGDKVMLSNLHRQIAYAATDIGEPKTARIVRRLKENNPEVNLTEHPRLGADNIGEIVASYDLVADGCDNFPTRYLVNEACVQACKPLVSAALSRFTGELAVFTPDGPCYQCLFPKMPDRYETQGCVEGGVLGPMAGLLGCWQALELLKQILNLPGRLNSEILIFDGLEYISRRIRLRRDDSCPACGGQHGADTLLRSIA
jgi:molybdopterin/thiamine biosynthesis adenylyltransferase